MWFKSESRGKFVHVTYAAVRDEAGDFQGVLNMFRTFNLIGRSIRIFIEEWSKDELRNRVYEGV